MSEPADGRPRRVGDTQHDRRGRRRAALALTALGTLIAASVGAYALIDPGDSADKEGLGRMADTSPAYTGTLREPTEAEKDTLHAAEQRLLRDCIRGRGFAYQVVSRRPVPEARDFPYVLDDTAWARRHGYGSDLQRQAERVRRDDPNQRYFRSLPTERRAAALAAVNGISPSGLTARTPDGMTLTRSAEGCRAQAERGLYGDLGAWFQARSTLEALREMRAERVLADAAYAKAARPWARCMRAAGHDYATPGAVRQAVATARPSLPRGQEIALAMTEATCARTSGLAATAKRLDRTYDTELRRRYRSDVNTGLRLQLAALPRARSLVE